MATTTTARIRNTYHAMAKGTNLCVDSDRGLGACRCHGMDVTLEFSNSLIQRFGGYPALYAGIHAEDAGSECNLECPGIHISRTSTYTTAHDFYYLHRETLTRPSEELSINLDGSRKNDHINKVGEFMEKYSENVCSGHGYCRQDSEAYDNSIYATCTCVGGYGTEPGSDWDEQCSTTCESRLQAFPYRYNEEQFVLLEAMGISRCGPHARCVDSICQPFSSTFGHMRPDSAADHIVLSDVLGPVNSTYYNKWKVSFYGDYGTCALNHYTRGTGSTVDRAIDGKLPHQVKWQIRRTCNMYYQRLSTNATAPYCCNAHVGLTDTDGYSSAGFTYGGCPPNQCANMASGRECDVCSMGFSSDTSSATCESSAHCATCLPGYVFWGNATVRSDHPSVFESHRSLQCIPILSAFEGVATRGKLVASQNSMHPDDIRTYTVKDISDDQTFSALQDYTIGTFECEYGYEGPTCSRITEYTNSVGCGPGVRLEGGVCDCIDGFIGPFCTVSSDLNLAGVAPVSYVHMVARQEETGEIRYEQVECAERGEVDIVTRKCVCNSIWLDPDTNCVEYYECVKNVRTYDICMVLGRVGCAAHLTGCPSNLMENVLANPDVDVYTRNFLAS